MYKTQHTPGPWEAAYGVGAGWIIKGVPNTTEMSVYNFDEGQKIPLFTLRKESEQTPLMDEQWIQIPVQEWEEMQEANARLIAAAPDMLFILQYVMDELNREHPHDWTEERYEEMKREVKDVVLKALQPQVSINGERR